MPTPHELSVVRDYTKKHDLELVHRSIFKRSVGRSMLKALTVPSKKHLGTRMRQLKYMPCTKVLFDEMTSTARGMPVSSLPEGLARATWPGYPQRQEACSLKPSKETSARRSWRLKLQRQDSVKAICCLEQINMKVAQGAVRLLTRRGDNRGERHLKKVCMMAGPVSIKFNEPMGKAKFERMPTMAVNCNVLTLEPTTAAVHFGVVNYPPWLKKWLRWDMYTEIEAMALRQRSLAVEIPPRLLQLIAVAKADPLVARKPEWSTLE